MTGPGWPSQPCCFGTVYLRPRLCSNTSCVILGKSLGTLLCHLCEVGSARVPRNSPSVVPRHPQLRETLPRQYCLELTFRQLLPLSPTSLRPQVPGLPCLIHRLWIGNYFFFLLNFQTHHRVELQCTYALHLNSPSINLLLCLLSISVIFSLSLYLCLFIFYMFLF